MHPDHEHHGADGRHRDGGKQRDKPVADGLPGRWNEGGGAALVQVHSLAAEAADDAEMRFRRLRAHLFGRVASLLGSTTVLPNTITAMAVALNEN